MTLRQIMWSGGKRRLHYLARSVVFESVCEGAGGGTLNFCFNVILFIYKYNFYILPKSVGGDNVDVR